LTRRKQTSRLLDIARSDYQIEPTRRTRFNEMSLVKQDFHPFEFGV